MSQFIAVILASSVLLALAVAMRAARVGRSAIAVAALAATAAAVPWFTRAHIELWNGLRKPLVPLLALVALHLCITLVLRWRLRKAGVVPIDCPRCGHASPRNTDGTPASDRPQVCPECGSVTAEWAAVARETRARRAWRYRCAVHAVLGGFVFAMLALFFVPLHRDLSEAPYLDILISDDIVEPLASGDGVASVLASTGMFVYRANFLHVLGGEDDRCLLVAVDPQSNLRQIAVLRNGIAPPEARERVAGALSKRGYDTALVDAVLDAAVIAVSANNDGERITLAPLHVGRWYHDLAWADEDPQLPPFATAMPWWRWILAALALAGAWALQPAPLTTPTAPHRRDRSRA